MENVFPDSLHPVPFTLTDLLSRPFAREFSKLKYRETKKDLGLEKPPGNASLGSTERVASPRDHTVPLFLSRFSIISPCNKEIPQRKAAVGFQHLKHYT